MSIVDAIKELREKMLADNRFTEYSHINSGLCENFSEELAKAFPGSYTIGVEEFQTPDCKFDWPLLAKWGISLPTGMTEEDLDALDIGGHLWLTFEGRHYDAECPEGVNSFFDLPYFQRQMTQRQK
jgi:hypothetical protein